MGDDKSKRGQPDRERVSSSERYEVDYLSRKHELPPPLVRKIVKQEGPMRHDVEKYLEKIKRNGRK